MTTDSFGSPGLGQGIALQAQPKDYSGQLVKGIIAGQAKLAKKAEKELEKESEYKEALSKFSPSKTGMRAFDTERQRIAERFFSVVKKLRDEHKPLKGSVEYREAEFKAENDFNKLKYLEDRYKSQVDKYAPNSANYRPVKEKISALDNEEEYLLQTGGDIYKDLGNLYNEKQSSKYFNVFSNITNSVTPDETAGPSIRPMVTQQGDYQMIFHDRRTKFRQEDIDNAWNTLSNSTPFKDYKQDMVEANMSEDEFEAGEKKRFYSQFKDSTKISASQVYEQPSLAGGKYGSKDFNWQSVDYGTSDNDEKLEGVLRVGLVSDYVNRPNIKAILDFVDGHKRSSKQGKLTDVDRSDISSINNGIEYFNLLIEKGNESAENLSKKLFNKVVDVAGVPYIVDEKLLKGGKSKELVFSAVGKRQIILPVISYNGESYENAEVLAYGVATTASGTDYKYFRVKIKNKQNEGREVFIPAGNDAYGKKNRADIGTPLSMGVNDWDDALEFYINNPRSRSTSFPKKEKGGLVEPKEISKRFHDKSRNMTKFVYSDGSEEIFKGLL